MIEQNFKGIKLGVFTHDGKLVVFQESDCGWEDIAEVEGQAFFQAIESVIGMFDVACLSCDWQGSNFALKDYQCPKCAGNVVDADELEEYSKEEEEYDMYQCNDCGAGWFRPTCRECGGETKGLRLFGGVDPVALDSPVIIFDGEGNILGHGEGG